MTILGNKSFADRLNATKSVFLEGTRRCQGIRAGDGCQSSREE